MAMVYVPLFMCLECQAVNLQLQQFPSVVVMYSLKAMKFGSRAAIQQFPRLLQLVELYPATMADFRRKVRDR